MRVLTLVSILMSRQVASRLTFVGEEIIYVRSAYQVLLPSYFTVVRTVAYNKPCRRCSLQPRKSELSENAIISIREETKGVLFID